jgi:hypothetical protein
MTLPIPLTVRLSTARADRHIERDLRSLSFRSVAPGGFASAQFSLDRPLALSPDELAYFGKAYIFDARNGGTVWEGRTEDLGRSVGSDGQIWNLAAIGPAAHAADDAFPYIPIDSEGERWLPSEFTANPRSGRVEQTNLDDDTDAVRLSWDAGTTITSTAPVSTIDVIYRAIYYAGGEVAHIRAAVKNGQTHSNHENRIVTRQAPSGSTSVVANATVSTSETVMAASLGGANAIPSGHSVVSLRMQKLAGTNPLTLNNNDNNQYGDWYGIFIRAKLKTKAGADITTGYTNSFVFAHEIVADLLGRFLPLYDGANATIESTTYHVDHLCYPGGTTAREVLDHLISLEPGFQWFAWESNSDGKHRFEWTAQPTTVRYEADAVDGYDGPGSAANLYNKALVAYTDWKGRYHTVATTQTVPALADAGITRALPVDLGSERSSALNAQQVGQQQLAEYVTPPNEGTLTVARPIYDHQRGTRIMPWEIRPGNLIRVRGIQPNINSLNATDRDGVTVFRIVAVDYDTASASATLELDSHPLSVSRALANLAKRGPRRRI